jgi:hypothetical protein
MYSVDLNLPLPLFDTHLSPVEFLKLNDQHLSRHFKLNINVLSKDLLEFFKEHDLAVRLVEIFYRPAGTASRVHVDTQEPGDYAKLNWAYGGEGSVMNWFSIKDDDKGAIDSTPVSSYAWYYNKSEVTLVHSAEVGQPSLVQVGIPHSVENVTTERFCVSIVFEYTESGQRPTFNQAYNIFKDYIK